MKLSFIGFGSPVQRLGGMLPDSRKQKIQVIENRRYK